MSLPQINLDNKPFPSDLDFLEMCLIIPNWDDLFRHHVEVMRLLCRYFFLESQQELRLLESICEHSGLRFEALIRAFWVRNYYQILFGAFLPNPRTAYELWLPNQNRALLEKTKNSWIAMNQFLGQRFSSYQNTEDILNTFEKVLNDGKTSNNAVLRALVTEYDRLQHKQSLAGYTEWQTLPKDSLPSTSLCPFCGQIFTFHRGIGVTKAPPHCGNLDCKKVYVRQQKASQRVKLKPADEWVAAFEGKQRRCRGGCGARRKVNQDNVCRLCFSKDKNRDTLPPQNDLN